MRKKNALVAADIFRYSARYLLLVVAVVVMLFALVSGSEDYGGGFSGIVKNSPNAFPWLLLLAAVFLAWKWELAGGIVLVGIGLILVYIFNFRGPNFFIATFILTLMIVLLGSFFLLSWYLRKKYR